MKKTIFLILSPIMIWQSAFSLSVTSTAGGLSAAVGADISTVTNLTVTGTIDARDMKCMRENMLLLAILDISGVNITEYTGVDGTAGTTSITYPANEMPQSSFSYGKSSPKSLTTITLPNSITSIGNYSFSTCINLTTVNIPSSVNSIGIGAFQSCQVLTNITIPNLVTLIQPETFRYCKALPSITIPSGVTSIGDNAFYDCNSLTSMIIPDAVTSIGSGAFWTCSKLTSVIIPNGITTILNHTFTYCSNLTNVSIPNGVTSIGNYAFFTCPALISITLPATVASIGDNTFAYCSGLKTFYCMNTAPPTLVYNSFSGTTTITDVFVPSDDAVIAYKADVSWFGKFPGTIIKKGTPTSITKLTDSQANVYSLLSSIIVDGTSAGETVSVYNQIGKQIQTIKSQGEKLIVPIKFKGVYLVKTAVKTVKVIL